MLSTGLAPVILKLNFHIEFLYACCVGQIEMSVNSVYTRVRLNLEEKGTGRG
jgi:hypothetical protein